MDVRKLAAGIGTAVALTAGAGCSVALAQQPRAAEPDRDVVLTRGQEVQVAGRDFTVRYRGLVSDSRCRPGLQCFVAGDAVVALVLAEPGRGERMGVHLHTDHPGPRETTYAAVRVELLDVSSTGDQVTLRLS
ncbi:hypothetical protein [Amycolatopsis jejuensis]|uniref:hypothetical protein n=1 Tax=Amycolatopsis jejuensis TaxID=330084 RepID=UPI0005250A27|nr:hypothetical protein [Amycolatopsis jejuensis]